MAKLTFVILFCLCTILALAIAGSRDVKIGTCPSQTRQELCSQNNGNCGADSVCEGKKKCCPFVCRNTTRNICVDPISDLKVNSTIFFI